MALLICDTGAGHRAGCGCGITRRAALGGTMAGLLAAATLGRAQAAPAAGPRRIDVHHHLAPPAYVQAINPKIPMQAIIRDWTPQQSLDDMDRTGVQTAMLSISTPGVWLGDAAAAAKLARTCNNYAAKLRADHPGRFGLFAVMPMPDIDGTLAEIAYALDVLKADGIGLYTSYGKKFLGDPSFAPVFEELNRRRAVVYTHPVSNACCVNLVPGLPDSIIEFGTDTTRTIASLVFSGAAARYADMNIIFSHAGGTMPFLIERFTLWAKDPKVAGKLPQGLMPQLRKFYYDTAQSANPEDMSGLTRLIPVSQVLFGSDFPYRNIEDDVQGLAGCGFTPAQLAAIDRGNALRLLGRR